ncbi:MAG: AmmeMemoRadiSam system radical SAM enzyme [Thaumarchaeota archaeon]|nr:AmmeMemoRadiSam system radical SAM enzyme [Nitrososphaerota archaeon]
MRGRPLAGVREADLYRVEGDRVVCTACARYCRLKEGQVGLCGVRANVGGRLMLLVYGRIIASHVDPIEKKPLLHFWPGSSVLSIATTGCNWLCRYCQNFDISQRRSAEGVEASPEEVVEAALRVGADGVTYTYNEPTIFMEFARDVGLLARARGLFNTFVTNGYMTPESAEVAARFLDAATVDFKGNGNPEFLRRYAGVPDPSPIYETLLELRRAGVHVEVTDLVVPGVGTGDRVEDARRLARWVADNLGPDTPMHFLRFHPDYLMSDVPPTPVEALERHREAAMQEGIRYAYVGNVPGHEYEHTYCPGCGRPVIRRSGFDIIGWDLDEENRCKYCGQKIPIVGKLVRKGDRFFHVPIGR